GSPYSWNITSNTLRTCGPSVFSTARQRNKNRLHASVAVRGSHRFPSPHRNQPLKSAHHTRLGVSACCSGAPYCGTRAPFRRPPHEPFPLEQASDTARRRPFLSLVLPHQIRSQLARPPARVFPPRLQDPLCDSFSHRSRAMVRSSTQIRQPLLPCLLIPLEKF